MWVCVYVFVCVCVCLCKGNLGWTKDPRERDNVTKRESICKHGWVIKLHSCGKIECVFVCVCLCVCLCVLIYVLGVGEWQRAYTVSVWNVCM